MNTIETLLARYFDGELDEREAREFLERVESDPKLESELRAYERLLALGKELPTPRVPTGFTQRVMADVRAEKRQRFAWAKPWGLGVPWTGLAVAAAAVVLAYVGGLQVGQNQSAPAEQVAQAGAPVTSLNMDAGGPADASGADVEYVRLTYVPTTPSVGRVAIAGSFNDWNPSSTPLLRKNGVWVTILVLPPGSYEYMFVEDDTRWVTDPLADRTREDGFGGENAVLDVGL
jgi:hypothetical protein